jgi:hypothetical protein
MMRRLLPAAYKSAAACSQAPSRLATQRNHFQRLAIISHARDWPTDDRYTDSFSVIFRT